MKPGSLWSQFAALLPRQAAALVALLCLGWAFTYAFSQETPIGSVRGKVILTENGQPWDGADIVLEPRYYGDRRAGGNTRFGGSKQGGEFRLTNVTAGEYVLSASSRAHAAGNTYITVTEGETTTQNLVLTRSEPDLAVKEYQKVFGTKEKPHFSVSGYVDGKKPAGTDAIKLRLYQTRLSNVLSRTESADAFDKVGRLYDPAPPLPQELLKPQKGDAPRLLLSQDVRITEDDREGFFYQKIPLDKLKTGLYLVDLTHSGHTACTWLLVTDTAVITKRAEQQIVAYTVDMQSGTPLPDSLVRAYYNGKIIAEKQSDSRGLAELTLPKIARNENDSRLTLAAIHGEDESVAIDSFYQREGEGATTLHAYTERTIYRPGQRVYFKGIARRRIPPQIRPGTLPLDAAPGETQPQYAVPAGEQVSVEIRTPSGERILQERYTTNGYGSFFGSVDIGSEMPTGNYTMLMRMGGAEHTRDILVTSYRKPEFAVTVEAEKTHYMRGDEAAVTVSAQYFFGAPLAGAKVKYFIYNSPDWGGKSLYGDEDTGDGYDGEETDDSQFFHHNYSESYYGETNRTGETQLDENGKAVIRFPTTEREDEDGPQDEIYTVSVTIIESANREVSEDGEVKVTSGDFRLGVRPEGYLAAPGQPSEVQLAAKDYDGHPIPNLQVELETGFEEWKREEDKSVYSKAGVQKVTLDASGKARISVIPPRAGEMVLKARAKDGKGRVILDDASLWVADDRGGDLDTEYADLSVMPDKRRYLPGDTARVLLNTARTGQTALLTIEGERVYRTQTVLLTKKSTVVRVPLPAEYGPNITLSACYVRNKHFAQSDATLRVTLPQRNLKIVLRADRDPMPPPTDPGKKKEPPVLARYHPGEQVTYQVTVTDAQGKPAPCEFSFGVVDEAIYAMLEDNPKALRDAFYPSRYNHVQTSYSFAIQYLGDADKAEPKIEARKKFRDTADWRPALQTDSEGRATVVVTLPDNLTTWRATVNAHTLTTRLGYAAHKIISAKDFLVRMDTPRFLTQKDAARILGLAHNETGVPQTVTLRLQADNLTVGGDATQTLTIEPGKVGQVEWPVTAENYGEAKLRLTGWTAKGNTGTQYTDGIEMTLPIRAHGREDITTFAGELTTNPETEVARLAPNAVPGLSRLTVRITPSLETALVGALDYLIGYPYGCTEQTMSRFLPDLLVQRALRRKGLSDVKHAEELPRMVRDGLSRLYRFQHRATGGWGWWEYDKDDPWMTAYVLYGLSIAKAEGYPVSENVLANGRKAAIKMLSEKAPATSINSLWPDTRPFLLYALALAGDKETARRERRKLVLKNAPTQDYAYLVLLDTLLGDNSSAALAALEKRAQVEEGLRYWTWGKASWFSDDRETTALALRALLAANRPNTNLLPVLRWLMVKRTGAYWGNTRATSWTLAALCDYLAAHPTTSSGGEVRVLLNGTLVQTYNLTSDLRQEREIVLRIPSTQMRPEKNELRLERVGGDSLIFYSVEMRQTLATEDIPAWTPAHLAGLSVQREYLRVLPKQAGQSAWTLQTEPTGNKLRAGDNIRVRLVLNAPRDMNYVLIEDPFPAGCEVTERGQAEEVVEWGYWWSSVDIRDDRVAFFARDLSAGQHIIEYNLRAQTPGSYHTLPTLLQGMYSPDARAETAETRIEIAR